MLLLKMVKSDSKIIVSHWQPESLIHMVEFISWQKRIHCFYHFFDRFDCNTFEILFTMRQICIGRNINAGKIAFLSLISEINWLHKFRRERERYWCNNSRLRSAVKFFFPFSLLVCDLLFSRKGIQIIQKDHFLMTQLGQTSQDKQVLTNKFGHISSDKQVRTTKIGQTSSLNKFEQNKFGHVQLRSKVRSTTWPLNRPRVIIQVNYVKSI